MTARLLVSFVAVAVLMGAPGLSAASRPAGAERLAQAETPLVVPPAGTTTPPAATTPPATAPATPPAASTTTPATPPAATPATPPAATGQDASPATPETPPAADGQDATPTPGPSDSGAEDNSDSPDNQELSLGEIPTIETMELTTDIAKRALDSYLLAKTKYADTDLDQYENLQDFVDQTDDGKKFEADVKAAGFANVTDWNLAVTTLGLTYSSITDDQTSDLKQQIKEVEDDTQLAQDMKDKMIKALKALIPSENNKKVVQDLMNDADYGPKLKQLDIEEE